MKKIITILLAIIVTACLTGCQITKISEKSETDDKIIAEDNRSEQEDKTEDKKAEKTEDETKETAGEALEESDTIKPEQKPEKNPSSAVEKPSVSPQVTLSHTTSEDSVETVPYKYGIKKIITTTKYYNVYSDGTRLLKSENKRESYDYSNYSATDQELMGEANAKAAANMAYYNEVLMLVNQIRAEAGAAPLTLDMTLCQAATMRSVEMNYSGVFSHTRPNETGCFSVLDSYNIRWTAVGENIAAGQHTPAQVVTSWKNSPGHYQNMVNPNYGKLGVGMSNERIGYGIYWTQLFTN